MALVLEQTEQPAVRLLPRNGRRLRLTLYSAIDRLTRGLEPTAYQGQKREFAQDRQAARAAGTKQERAMEDIPEAIDEGGSASSWLASNKRSLGPAHKKPFQN
jgi:hypothetical protein